ncbi:MAG: Gfo/Idh/MocA family oxidoreductase [Timaviella obliquedivisa GSE-PSE-MK23-08B]|jgi:predicted dehydrogenase|nr:Gfo/Idh/MocA family oxidoreductase [Timaviella obliquedivisa GSE-PSE-MK23-08B]
MAHSPIGVAVVGTGFGQKIHIPGLQIHPHTEVVAVHHRDLEKGRAIAQTHAIPRACQTIEELVALPEVQAVTISTPPFLHYDMAKKVLQAGKHLLLEKPTALNVQEAVELYQLAETNGAIVILDFEFRFVPAWQRFAELLADGYVGQKRLVKVDWLVSGRADASKPWNWYARKDQGGGALGAIGSHCFDYLAWLFAPAKRLSGRLSTTIPTRIDPTDRKAKPVDADDTCCITLELADGVLCQVALSAVTYQGRGHWVEVYGDRGTLILGSDNQTDYVHGFRIMGSQNGQPLQALEIPEQLAFSQTYQDGRLAPFIRVIDRWVQGIELGRSLQDIRKKSPTPSLREGVYSQLLMDLTHQSHEANAWMEVPNLEKILT